MYFSFFSRRWISFSKDSDVFIFVFFLSLVRVRRRIKREERRENISMDPTPVLPCLFHHGNAGRSTRSVVAGRFSLAWLCHSSLLGRRRGYDGMEKCMLSVAWCWGPEWVGRGSRCICSSKCILNRMCLKEIGFIVCACTRNDRNSKGDGRYMTTVLHHCPLASLLQPRQDTMFDSRHHRSTAHPRTR
jgi:hypothetical protein